MQTLFIIGNGFDMNLGMKTSYNDFYKYYLDITPEHELVQKLKSELKDDYDSWADLEIAFGNFTKHLKNLKEFDTVFDDIGNNLAEYLKSEQDKFEASKVKKDLFFKYLHSPEDSLTQADINELKSFKNRWKSHQWTFNIITLNYTYTIENIIETPVKDIPIGNNGNVSSILRSIHHIHGFIDNRMVLGVNDESQVSNKELIRDKDILESIIKENANKAAKHTIENACINLVNNANLICIFGSSIGDTDKNWWSLIGERLKHGTKVIIFTKGEEINLRAAYKTSRTERAVRERFLSKTDLNESEREQFGNNVYVGINTDMFSIM